MAIIYCCNVQLRYLLNAKPLLMSCWRSALNEVVNDWGPQTYTPLPGKAIKLGFSHPKKGYPLKLMAENREFNEIMEIFLHGEPYYK